MNTESGNMGVWLNQHERWPPLELSVIARGDCSSTECVIFAHPDGHLSFTVSSSNRQIIEYHSQRIEFFEPVTAFLAANWLNSAADIFLNGQKLLPLSREAPALLVMSSAPTLIANGPISFEASEAELICKQWIEWRHTFFTSTSTVARRGGRRVKSELEQYDELARSQRVLRDLITIGDSGADHVLGCLAAELRALVYWDEKRKHSQYSPLLLRVASKSRTPLPVWSFIV